MLDWPQMKEGGASIWRAPLLLLRRIGDAVSPVESEQNLTGGGDQDRLLTG